MKSNPLSVMCFLFGYTIPIVTTILDDPVATIWGFYNTKKSQYYAPRNAKSVGDPVDINDTRDYTAMQINLGPLAGILC